jgi:hypothetical protein
MVIFEVVLSKQYSKLREIIAGDEASWKTVYITLYIINKHQRKCNGQCRDSCNIRNTRGRKKAHKRNTTQKTKVSKTDHTIKNG